MTRAGVSNDGLTAALLRFWTGTLAAVLAGLLRYRNDVFVPTERPFECVYIGALAAGMLATVRAGKHRHALALVIGFAVLQLAFRAPDGLLPALPATATALFMAGGLFVIAVMYDEMGRAGMRFGKFLIMGMMLAWLYFAVTPLAAWGRMLVRRALEDMMENFVLGMTIGLGVGLAVEIVEFLPGLQPGRDDPGPQAPVSGGSLP